MTKTFVLAHDIARSRAIEAVKSAPHGLVVQIKEPTRTLDQNAAQWPILEAFADQRLWPVNGEKVKMSKEEWKDVLSAAFKRETARLAMGIDGGVVMLGKHTSKFTKKEFSEWMEFLHSVAAARGVTVYGEMVA